MTTALALHFDPQEALERLQAATPHGAALLRSGGRAGLDGTLHRVSAMRSRDGRVLGLTFRVGRHVPGAPGAGLVRLARLAPLAPLRQHAWRRAQRSITLRLLCLPDPHAGAAGLIMDVLAGLAAPRPSKRQPPAASSGGACGEECAPPSLLLLGPPGVGASTLLRDCCGVLSSQFR